MKVALCLYGQVGGNVGQDGNGGWRRPSEAYPSLNKMLFSRYDTDVFLHSWNTHNECENQILSTYDAKKYEIVPQIQFQPDMSKYGLNDSSDYKGIPGYDLLLESRGSWEAVEVNMKQLAFRSQSRWYSTKRSIELKEEYEKENDFIYDFVFISRFDNWFDIDLKLEEKNPEYFYAGPRTSGFHQDAKKDPRDSHLALEDLWFMSGSENMNKFGKLYDNIYDYCIRPPFAAREHVNAFIGEENIRDLGWWGTDYGLLRHGRY